MDKQQRKIFILSLDGATFDILKPLISMGFLPNLNQLMESGSHTELESTIPYITPAAWASFMTGTLPEKHGVFDFLQFIPHTYETRLANSQSIRGRTIWRILSEKGKKVAVIHLPMTYPPYEVNGLMVSGFDTPSLKTDFTYPKNLKKEILNIIPDYDFHVAKAADYFHNKGFETFMNQLKRSLEQRHLIARHMLEREPWDVFMVNFQDLDCLHHNVWHYLDYQSSGGIASERKKIIVGLLTYMDTLIGDLLDKAHGKFSHVMIVSDHGAGPAYITVHPNSLLKEWGFLSVYEDHTLNKKKKTYLKFKKIVRTIRGDFDSDAAKDHLSFSRDIVNWRNTRAYVPIADIAAFCYINKTGREKGGIVTDSEYDRLCNEIRDRFLSTYEPLSGIKAFKEVFIGKDYFRNNGNPDLPDLILVPNDGFTVNKAFATKRNYSTPSLSGTHKRNGVLIVKGNNVKQGFTEFKANIIDMAPTILYILDLPIQNDMDGHPLMKIFDHESQEAWLENTDKITPIENKDQKDFSKEEKELIEKRLKSLGYL